MTTDLLEKEVKLVAFSLNGKEYALDIHHVHSIEKMLSITRVPGVPSFIKGVINLRGNITPIIDLRSRFQIEEKEYDDRTRIIIVSLDGKEVGLIVDEANDVLTVKQNDIKPHPEVIGSEKQHFIQGVIKENGRLFIVLQLENVLNLQEER